MTELMQRILPTVQKPARNTRHIATAHTAHFTLDSIAPTL